MNKVHDEPEGVIGDARKLAVKAKKAGLSYQGDWLAAWPGGASPNRGGANGALMNQIVNVANELHNEYYGLYDGGRRDGIDERGTPGLNDGYQIWIRLWPNNKQMKMLEAKKQRKDRFSFGSSILDNSNEPDSPDVRGASLGRNGSSAMFNNRDFSQFSNQNARFNNGSVSPRASTSGYNPNRGLNGRARRNSGSFSPRGSLNGNF